MTMSSVLLPSARVTVITRSMTAAAVASLAASAPAGKVLSPTPKNRIVGAGMKKSTGGVLAMESELLVKVTMLDPEAVNTFGGREFCKKNPFTPTPNSPLAFALEEANGLVWLVGTLGNGIPLIPVATTRTSAAGVMLPNGALWRSRSAFTG